MPPINEIIVVGCGVSGLTCGIKLAKNFSVKIIAEQIPPHTTSNAAPAYWSPYKNEDTPLDRVLFWSKVSLDKFYSLAYTPNTGVSIDTLIDVFQKRVDYPWWHKLVRHFREATLSELPAGYTYGHAVEIPKIDSSIHMQYLVNEFLHCGGKIEQRTKPLKQLNEIYGDNLIIINCSGIGAYHLCSDIELFPIRGQTVIVDKTATNRFIRDLVGPTFVVPRTNDCVLGGTFEENNWNLDIDPNLVDNILHRCAQLAPELANAKIIDHKVGLRPGRKEVRLELEKISDTCAVIHNYGHGRAGFAFSWGCAEEVCQLANAFLSE